MLKLSQTQENIRKFQRNKTNNYINFLVYKSLNINLYKFKIPMVRKYLYGVMKQQNKHLSSNLVKTVCLLTGRNRSVYRFFRISRLKIREYGQAGYFTGLRKAS